MTTQYKPRDNVQVLHEGEWKDSIYLHHDPDPEIEDSHFVYMTAQEFCCWFGDDNIRPAPPDPDTIEVRAWVGMSRHGTWDVIGYEGCKAQNAVDWFSGATGGHYSVVAEIVARVPRSAQPPVIEGEVIA